MLQEANIESELIERLGDGMRHLGEQATKMGEAADVSSAAQDYGNALNSATENVSQLANDYSKVSESLTGLEAAGEMSSTVGNAMQQMTENLTSLNDMYGAQLEQLKVNAELYTGMGELVQNLNDSVEDTKLYKENIAQLSKNLASLNNVYGNMLNAMGR
jgi:gliding motility-associated protein GldL